jgi:hypothetical protein
MRKSLPIGIFSSFSVIVLQAFVKEIMHLLRKVIFREAMGLVESARLKNAPFSNRRRLSTRQRTAMRIGASKAMIARNALLQPQAEES